ncbi:MAG TPA: hypothetical protein PLZ45_12650 [Ferruginibacter sp.]|nr:hypothetical protein [Ferruginibacter sp.]
MRLTYRYLLLALPALFLSACKKSGNDCAQKAGITLSPGSTNITEGWDLTLSVNANYNPLNKYVFSGPNGWSVQLNGATAVRPGLQMQDAGTYMVRAYDVNNCQVQEGSVSVTVTPVTNPPCQAGIANNTITSDINGISSFTFNAVYFGNSPTTNSSTITCYLAPPAPGNPSMSFTFLGYNRPKPGLYKTIYGFNAFRNENEVSFYLYDPVSGKTYIASQGQDVYVNLVSGKIQVCFCNTEVRDAPSGNLKYMTGKLTVGN